MASTIYTPVTIFSDFEIKSDLKEKDVVITDIGGTIVKKFYIDGNSLDDGKVEIFCTSVYPREGDTSSALIVVPDSAYGIDVDFMIALASEGYAVFSADLLGKTDAKDYTKYPESISYANFSIAKDNLYSVKTDVKGTCWYEWARVYKHLSEFVFNQGFNFVGGIGVGSLATVLYHVSANEKRFSAVAFLYNAGWEAQKEKHDKTTSSSDFSDEMIKYIAGIEPEAYVPYISCPMYFLSATNSQIFEMDRTADTVIRAKASKYSVLDYSVNARNFANFSHYKNVLQFFATVVKEGKAPLLPEVQDLKCDVLEDRIRAITEIGKIPPKSVCLYVSEGKTDPEERIWTKVEEKKPEKNANSVVFEYFPKKENVDVYLFVRAEFEKGYKAGSNVVMKRTDGVKIAVKTPNKVIFSSREDFGESVFFAVRPDLKTPIDYVGKYSVRRESGPMGIEGVTCSSGLVTLKTLADGNLLEDSVLILDVYVKEDATVKVSLLHEEDLSSHREYSCCFKLNGEEIWHNLKTELKKFKGIDGSNLRSFEGVKGIKIECDEEFLLNNALWV